jgi:hypothetical protein
VYREVEDCYTAGFLLYHGYFEEYGFSYSSLVFLLFFIKRRRLFFTVVTICYCLLGLVWDRYKVQHDTLGS